MAASKKSKIQLGVLGVGKMGEAIIRGLHQDTDFSAELEIRGSEKSQERASSLANELHIEINTDSRKLLKESDILLLAVKPHQAQSLLKEIAADFQPRHLLISICAALSRSQLEEWSSSKVRVIRAMPNLPCTIQKGMTVLSSDAGIDEKDLQIAEKIFKPLGKTARLPESLFDGVTALSACGPAFIFLILEALSEAGVKVGIPRDVSIQLAAQTMAGSAEMVLEGSRHPAELKDQVTTPGGCTIDGLMALEEGRLRATLIRAVLASSEKSALMRKS